MTAGPCREPIDPVRFISNRSSGKMGYAIAQAALSLGAKVTLVSGPTSLQVPVGVELIEIETTAEMQVAVSERFDRSDCLIMAAAPSDYAPVNVPSQKIKKSDRSLTIELEPTIDILKSLKERKRPGQLVIGFALETENGIENAREKLARKGLDLILLNEVSQTASPFDSDSLRVTLIRPGRGPEIWPINSKEQISRRLLDYIAGLW